ncbi:hypothetical protein IMPR6_690177 [Imperialibacter sp. EC-SDR9]|nr:hypothetical protein IMPERIA89_340177 [Imperialibacter sp. 89]CAD5296833.1 hypothetical protein IMPERIA75_700177 [Imperialibacter sp. 75]VVT33914.1 hypothetical protein IMPR6_690177 [Imperialibacter sp. EC-SDR9]
MVGKSGLIFNSQTQVDDENGADSKQQEAVESILLPPFKGDLFEEQIFDFSPHIFWWRKVTSEKSVLVAKDS